VAKQLPHSSGSGMLLVRLRLCLMVLSAIVAVTACGSAPSHHLPPRNSHLSHTLLVASGQPAMWILAFAHFDQVVAAPQSRAVMKGGMVFEPISVRQRPSGLLPVLPTFVVHSYAALEFDFQHHAIPSGTRAILYDNERFADTPRNEQADPGYYDGLVAAFARAHKMVSICDFIQPDRLRPSQRLPADEVPPCDIVGLNTVQQSERDPQQYATKVIHMVTVVHDLNPRLPVLAGLSTNPAGSPVTARELVSDVRATRRFVSGYWLNVPAPGVGCPRCHLPDPSILVTVMGMLAM